MSACSLPPTCPGEVPAPPPPGAWSKGAGVSVRKGLPGWRTEARAGALAPPATHSMGRGPSKPLDPQVLCHCGGQRQSEAIDPVSLSSRPGEVRGTPRGAGETLGRVGAALVAVPLLCPPHSCLDPRAVHSGPGPLPRVDFVAAYCWRPTPRPAAGRERAPCPSDAASDGIPSEERWPRLFMF